MLGGLFAERGVSSEHSVLVGRLPHADERGDPIPFRGEEHPSPSGQVSSDFGQNSKI